MRKPILKTSFLFAMLVAAAVPAFGQLAITNGNTLPSAVVNASYNVQLVTTGVTGNVTFSLNPPGQTLPPGMSLSTTGVISGTATSTTGSPFSFTIRATDSTVPTALIVDKTFTLTVLPALSISDLTLPNGTVGVAYSKTMVATGGFAPYSWQPITLGGSGLSMNANGVISGTPTAAGTFNNIVITVGDSSTPQLTASRTYSLTIGAGSAPAITTNSPLPAATINRAYSQTLAATGGTGALTYSVAPGSSLPGGLTLTGAGVLSGTPTNSGTFNFSLRVTDTGSQFSDKAFALTVNPALLITTGTLPAGAVGSLYSTTLQTTGGTAPITWSQTGTLPTGLTFTNSTGVITGTPTTAQSATLSYTATDANGASATLSNVTLTVNAALSISTATPLPAATQNASYSQTITAAGGASSSYVFGVAQGSTLPTGLTFTPQGLLSGTPTAAGTFSFTLQVTDGANVTATKAFSLTVNPAGGSLTITTASPLPAGAVGSVYSVTLAALGGTGTGYQWSLPAGNNAPAGLTLSQGGVLSGTPTGTGTTSFSIQVRDSANATATKSFLLTINPALVITNSSPLPNGSVNAAYSQTLQATGGTGSYSWTLAVGSSLPAGLTLSTTGVLSGTPTVAASPANFTVQVTDSAGVVATKAFQLTVSAAGGLLSISTASPLTAATVGTSYSQAIAATGGSGTGYSFLVTVGSLPAGLTLATSGLLTGTPTAAGTATFTVQVTDSASGTATKQFQLTVNPAGLNLSTQTLPNWTQGAVYSQALAVTGGSAPYTWSVPSGQLPAGLTWGTTTGVLSGTPTAAGTYTFTAQVVDSTSAMASRQFTVIINSPPSITATTPAGGVLSTAYSTALSASGGTAPLAWSLATGSLPTGLALNASSGAITGTPTAAGTFTFTAQVTDAAGATATRQFSIVVAGSALSVVTTTLPNPVLNTAYSQTLQASGGTGTYTWAVTLGGLPAGLTLAANTGVISGAPNNPGQSTFTVTVTDSANTTATRQFTLTVLGSGLTITTTALPEAVVNSIYTTTVAASGGSGTGYVWSVAAGSASLPAGLSLSPTGQISGTPTSAGVTNVTLQVTDSLSTVATRQFTLAVASTALTITSNSPLPDANQNLSYSANILASGGVGGTYSFSVTAQVLPPGLTLLSNGTISGIPSQAGTFTFTVQVTDGFGGVSAKPFTLTVVAPNLSITSVNLPAAGLNASYSTTLSGLGGTQPYQWSVVIGILPPGLNLNSTTGAITGTPTATGSFNFRVQLRDNVGLTAFADLSILVMQFGVTTSVLPDGQTGVAYNSTLSAVGGAQPYSWSVVAGLLPPGLNLGATGQLTGTPTTQGQYTFTIQVRDATNATSTKQFTVAITGGLSVVTQSLPNGTVSVPYDQTLQATGGTAPYTWAVTSGALPVGLTLNSATGAIRGTPITTIGSPFQFVVQVTDAANARSERLLTIIIASSSQTLLSISTASLPNAVAGTAYTATLAATGGTAPYTFSIASGVLPAGFTLAANGAISGIAQVAQVGTYPVTYVVTDAANQTATKQLSLVVTATGSLLTITTTSLPGGNLGALYSQSLAASGATGALTWLLASGSTPLPPGLVLSTAGVISGTPLTAGSYNFTVQVSDSTGAVATRALAITIGSGITILTQTVPAGVVNQPYAAVTLSATGGAGLISWILAPGSGNLPPGITLSTAGVLSGFPTQTGTFNFTVRASDPAGNLATQAYTLVISASGGALQITTTTIPSAVLNVPYTTTLLASGGTSSVYSWSVAPGTLLPVGFTLSTAGVLSGTPVAVGSFPFVVQVRDISNTPATQTLTLQVTQAGGALSIVTTAINNPVLNTPFTFQLSASGGTGSYNWTAFGTLPAGLTLAPTTGTLSGTPTQLGTYTFVVQVTDTANVSVTRPFTVSVTATGFSITTQSLPAAGVGTAYSFNLQVTGGTAPYTWSVVTGALPAGIVLTPTSGLLSGTATAGGTFNITVQVVDATSATATRSLVLQVSQSLSITTVALPAGSVGAQYNQTLTATGGTGTGFTWLITSGTLPPGVSLNAASGVLSGTATVNGTFNFTVQVTDSAGVQASKALSIQIGVTLSIGPESLPGGATGVAYSAQLNAVGGTAPYTWSVSGEFPPGLNLNVSSGAITGTPALGGNYTFTIRLQDANQNAVTRQYTVAIREGLSISTPTALPNGSEGLSYLQTLAAAGGTAPYTWSVSVGSLPPGLSLNPSTGVISGTPQSIGNYSFIVMVADAQQQSVQKAFTMQVGGRMSIVTATLPNAAVRTPYSETLVVTGGVAPYTWSLAAGGTPPIGITVDRSGVVSGTPATAGVFTFTVQVTDSAGTTVTRTFTLTVGQSIVLTTTSPLPAAVAGVAYSQSLAATGGTQPYSWTVVTGALPAGLTLNGSTGVISGVPSAAGTFSFTVQVADSNRQTASANLSMTVTLPASPAVNISGLSDAITPAQQPRISVSTGAPFPVALNGTLTMTFASDAAVPLDDPAVVFTNGRRTIDFVIPANETQAQLPAGFAMQTGTVSGSISLAVTLRAGTQDVTPSPAPVISGRIAKAAPALRSVSARRVASGLEVTITAYSTTREVTSAVFRFTPAPGSSLQTTELTVPLTDGAQRWYQSEGSRPFGSQFTLTQQFNVQGDTSAISSVTVTLNNAQGASAAASANFQ